METRIFKVVAQGEPIMVPSKKQVNGQLAKCYIRLKSLGGDYEDEFVAAMFGNMAQCRYAEDTTVVASLRFQSHDANGSWFQDVVVSDIRSI